MTIHGIKGMNDILPDEIETWQFLESTARRIFGRYGFDEIRLPVVEKTELFARSIGESTDIVEKEMYTFEDRSGNSLTLRPEGTASVVRAFIEHKLHNRDPVARLLYLGPMFRYERPQKGRYRQFYQIGVEALGLDDPRIDAQVLAMLAHFLEEIGLADIALKVNSLGCPECRPAFRQALIDFLEQRLEGLCADCRRRYLTNPLRTLDCKVPGCQEQTAGAPRVLDHLCAGCDAHFARVRELLDELGVVYEVNPRMVRGLDYYTRTTFEAVTDRLGAQNAVAAGGRYDGLVQELGGPALPGIGFAMGMERLVLLREGQPAAVATPDLFVAVLGDAPEAYALGLAHRLQRSGLRVELDFQGRSLKAQLRRADKLGSRQVLILGEEELRRGSAPLRDMASGEQREVSLATAAADLLRAAATTS